MFLTVLLVMLLVLLLIMLGFCFWHILVPVPFVPTTNVMIAKMIALAKLQPQDIVYDLGAGDARLLIAAKKDCPSCKTIGYEFLPSAYLQGRIKIWLQKLDVRLLRRSFYKADLADASVIFLYLFPNIMQKLESKFRKELTPGTRIISHAFQFKDRKPNASYKVKDGRRMRDVYVYIW